MIHRDCAEMIIFTAYGFAVGWWWLIFLNIGWHWHSGHSHRLFVFCVSPFLCISQGQRVAAPIVETSTSAPRNFNKSNHDSYPGIRIVAQGHHIKHRPLPPTPVLDRRLDEASKTGNHDKLCVVHLFGFRWDEKAQLGWGPHTSPRTVFGTAHEFSLPTQAAGGRQHLGGQGFWKVSDQSNQGHH